MLMDKLRLRMLLLHEFRHQESDKALKAFLRSCGLQSFIILLLVGMVVLLGDLPLWLSLFMVFVPILYVFLLVKRLDQQIARMKLSYLLELPLFVNKLLLLLQSGIPLHAAFLRTASSYSDQDQHPLARQMNITLKQLQNHYPFAQVLEELSRRCAAQEITYFTTSLLMNYRRGGEELTASLRTLSRELWDRRKNAVKTLGEEASAKMVFPLMLIFIAVMLAVGAPAIMQLNG